MGETTVPMAGSERVEEPGKSGRSKGSDGDAAVAGVPAPLQGRGRGDGAAPERSAVPCAYALLPSKFHVPARVPDVVRRAAVQAKLDRALACRLTTVVAPAGFGKTTAVAAWAADLADASASAAARPMPAVAWCAVGPEDAAGGMFWRYVLAALCAADVDLAGRLEDVRVPDAPATPTAVLDALILALGACPRAVVLVLEDFYNVQDAPGVAGGVQYLLRNLPPNAHLAITSRRPLALALSKLRVAGQLVEVTEADLRFSAAEAAAFFAAAVPPAGSGGAGEPAPEAIARIEALTRGWPAGCRLVAMLGSPALASAPAPADVRADDSLAPARAGMGEYLFEEVFLTLSSEQRDFLVKTSVVRSFCPSLAAALTGGTPDEAREIVERLAASDLFVERIEHAGAEDWYRYHLLFADMLRSRAAALGPDAPARGKAAARDWYARNGYLDRAAGLSADLGDWRGLRQLVVDNWKALYMADEHQVLVRWASLLPPDEVLGSPFVCAVLAMPYALVGRTELANAYIMHAVSRLKDDEDFLFAFCMVQKAFLASFKADFSAMRQLSEKALRYLPPDEFYLRGMMLQVQASSYSPSDPLRARDLLLRAVEAQEAFGNKNLTCSALGNLAVCCANLGYPDEAELYARRAFSLYVPDEWTRKPMLGHAYLAREAACCMRGDAAGALAASDAFKGLEPRRDGGSETHAEALALRARALLLAGDAAGAAEAFARALDASTPGAALALPGFALARGCAAGMRAQSEARLARTVPAPGQPGPLREGRPALFLFDALVLACRGAADAALCERACALADALPEGERALKVHALVVAAVLCEQAALTLRADACVLRAAGIAGPSGLATSFSENAVPLAPVVARVLADRGTPAAAVAFLRGAAGAGTRAAVPGAAAGARVAGVPPFSAAGMSAAPSATAGVPGAGATSPDAPLTERELDVMRLVASGMSVAETADRLVVSRETVKKHLANIYGKLGVHSKMQAAALLRERGVL